MVYLQFTSTADLKRFAASFSNKKILVLFDRNILLAHLSKQELPIAQERFKDLSVLTHENPV